MSVVKGSSGSEDKRLLEAYGRGEVTSGRDMFFLGGT